MATLVALGRRTSGRALLVVLMMVLAACGKSPDLIVYVSADEQVARPIIEAFEQESGLVVGVRYDTEATKTTALASLLRAERERPRADVFWSSECFAVAQLAMEGSFEPLDAGVFGEDEVFQVLGNRPFTGVPFPGGLGMGQPTDGGEHPKARRFHFRD